MSRADDADHVLASLMEVCERNVSAVESMNDPAALEGIKAETTEALRRARDALEESGAASATRFRVELRNLENRFRTACAIRKAREGLEADAERKRALLSGKSGEDASNEAKHEHAAALARESEASLSRTWGLLAKELSRMSKVSQVLQEDVEILEDVSGEYGNVFGYLKASGAVLTQLHRREMLDKYIVNLALAFFALVVFYIIQRRLFPIASGVYYLVNWMFGLFQQNPAEAGADVGSAASEL